MIRNTGLPHDERKFKDLGNNIFELKTRSGFRILCFTGGGALPRSLILTHGFKKPQSRMLQGQIQKAINLRRRFFQTGNTIEITELWE